MIDEKLLSIIVPVYNCEKYLERCVLSLLQQELDAEQYEIICVNDGSTDGSLRILKEYASKHSNIRVIDQPNGGVSSARNTGIENATGKYIAFVDGDDMVYGKAYAFLTEQAEKVNADLVLFSLNMCKESDDLDVFMQPPFSAELSSLTPFGKVASTSVCRELIRLSIIKENNLRFSKNISMGEDHLFNEKLLCYVSDTAIWQTDHILYLYRQYANSSSQNNHSKTVLKKQNSMMQIARECSQFTTQPHLSEPDKKRLLERQYEAVASALLYSLFLGSKNAREVKRVLKTEKLYPYKLTPNFFGKKRSVAKYLNLACRFSFLFGLIVMLLKIKETITKGKCNE